MIYPHTHSSRWFTLLVTAWLLISLPMTAQTKKTFTLDDLMSGGTNYWNIMPSRIFGNFWGERYVQFDANEARVVADAKGRQKKPQTLFTADEVRALLGADNNGAGLNLYTAQFPDATKTEVLLRTPDLNLCYDWRQRRITWQAPRTRGIQHADFCPASRSEAYVKNWNLFLRTADGTEHQISHDGSRELQYGTSVHRDEFGYTKGTFFSPSGQKLCFTRMDQTMVRDYPLVDISQREAVEAPEKYPMAGMESHKVNIGVYDPQSDRTIYMQTGDPTDRYFTNPSWSPDEKTLYLIELPRTQDKAELVAYNAETGVRKGVIYTETNEKYVHPVHGLTFLPWDDKHFLYQSERDGYNHLYLMDTTGKDVRQVTSGSFVVLDVLGFNAARRSVIILSTEASPLRNNLYAVDIVTGQRTLLDNGLGVHQAALSPAGTMLFDCWTAPDVFREYDVLSTVKADVRLFERQADPWTDYDVPEISSGTLTAADGSTPLFYRLVKPTHFDPTQKYPTVVYVYGGPGLRNVEERWHYAARPWEVYMAQKGYCLFVLDNRGSTDRGFAFESCTFRHLGDEEMRDQMVGVDFLRHQSFVDTARLGVHGWSFGGYMTTNLMCSYPDVFKVGVAGGPVIDWKYYEVMYGERYMDTPAENPAGYESSSLLPKAKNLKGRLQIIFGYNDPTCVPQHTLSFVRTCIDAGTQPDLFTYPGQGHNMYGRDQVHLHERISRYFDDYLK